jgi:indoleamine 2,3-dioxygenase
MCPHAVPSPHYASECGDRTLAESEIESSGFLPEQPPLDSLSDPYYGPWETLIKHLPKLLKDKTIRSRTIELPVLSVSRLKTIPEWRRAYVILSFLAHGYIWGGDHAAQVS